MFNKLKSAICTVFDKIKNPNTTNDKRVKSLVNLCPMCDGTGYCTTITGKVVKCTRCKCSGWIESKEPNDKQP